MTRSNLPDSKQYVGKAVPDGDFLLESLIGKGCNALVFKGHSQTLGQYAAYKLIPRSNLRLGEFWATEAQKANALEHPSVVKCTWFYDWSSESAVILKYDYVDGPSLREFVKKHKDQITVDFVLQLFKVVLEVFYEMQRRNLQHGDFHSGNVLVKRRSEYQIVQQEEFRITDFGVGPITGDAKIRDDYEQLAVLLEELLSCIDYQTLTGRDKYKFDRINDQFVTKCLREKDQTREPLARNPKSMHDALTQLDREFDDLSNKDEARKMLTPFDYLSCEQIGKAHSLLSALYSDKFLGLGTVEGANNLVVTGPRGCGKSTVFQSLSIGHRLLSRNTSVPINYIGIYYHCKDLYFKFPRYETSINPAARNLPIHYLTCRLVVEMMSIMALLKRENLLKEDERDICEKLWAIARLDRPNLPSVDTFMSIAAVLNKECRWAIEKQQFANDLKQPIKSEIYGPGDFAEIVHYLHDSVEFFRNRPFYLFIDDYSMPHISEDLQKNLNRMLMQRDPVYFTKLATESPVSFSAADIDGKFYAEGREFELLNLGLVYIQEEKNPKLDFIDDVFNRRLAAVDNFPVETFTALVGDNEEFIQNRIADALADGEKVTWWGRQTLSSMCSGDVHQIITIVRRMVSTAGGVAQLGKEDGEPGIPKKHQTRAIREHAGAFLKMLADNGELGQQIVNVVTTFGNISNSHLKYRRSKNETGNPRYQASRIELYEPLDLSDEAQRIYDELIRYSVFIEDPRGKSVRGKAVPRLYMRRFLVPHFKLTFNQRDSIKMSPVDFEKLLLEPLAYEELKRLKKDTDIDEMPTEQLDFLKPGTGKQ